MIKKIAAIGIAILFLVTFPVSPKNESRIVLNLTFDKPVIGDEGIEMKGCKSMDVNGLILPAKPLHILLPYGKDAGKIKVTGKKVYFGEYKPVEAKPLILNGIKIKEKADYEKATPMYQKVGEYWLRGYRILVLNILPLEYKNGKTYYYSRIKVEIDLKDGEINELYRGMERDREWVRRYIDNPWMLDEYPMKESCQTYEYLIITGEKFKNAFQKFAEYKEEHGIKTKIATVEEIIANSSFWNANPLFNDTQAKIRRFIRYAYQNWGIEYVLLGGDGDVANESSNIIPPRYLYATCYGLPLGKADKLEAYIPSDVYYACLDGDFNTDEDDKWGENASGNSATHEDEADLYAEVWVGRACVDSIKEINNFMNKTISYEESSEDDRYIMQILLLGEYLGFGGEAEWGGNHKDNVIPFIPYSYNITTLYDRISQWSKYDLAKKLNNGVNIVNHDGHGWTTYALKMRNYDLHLLNNTKYFFLYSQTCLAGSFDNWYPENHYYEDDCFAEHLTLDEHGAFACIMNARYGLGRENSTDSPGERYDLSFFKALFQENIREIGRANHYSKEDNVWRIDENGMRWTYYETNLFGDPMVEIKEPGNKIEVNVEIEKPGNGLYLFNFGPFLKFMNKSIVIGSITIEVNASTNPEGNMKEVKFYVDNELMSVDNTAPYQWTWSETTVGKHIISVEAIATNGNSRWKSIEVFKIM